MTIHVVGVFCEDIREEKSGQVTLVGVLPDNINVPPPPTIMPSGKEDHKLRAIIPKLGLYVRVHMGLDDDPGLMTIKLLFSDKSELVLGTMDAEIITTAKQQAKDKGIPIAGILTHIVINGLAAPTLGVVLAVIDTKDQRYICAVLNLMEIEAPTSSQT